MKRKRWTHSAEFKARVVAEALRGIKPIREIATENEVHPVQVSQWKLVVVMDWATRAVLPWRLSNTLDTSFCVAALEEARRCAGTWPEIMNTDQGCQFTSQDWTVRLREAGVKISMDGRGR